MKIKQHTQTTIEQCIDIIEKLNNDMYIKPLDVINQSTIGQHFRHIIEFYIEFVNGYKTTTICYDDRKRNLIYENSRAEIIAEFKKLHDQIEKINLNQNIMVKSNHSVFDSNYSSLSSSSIQRELIYTLDHTVHHLAIIKIAIQTSFPQITLNNDIGVAPSTIRNNKLACAQ
jgi:hypothetical protein